MSGTKIFSLGDQSGLGGGGLETLSLHFVKTADLTRIW